jgi:hypothetical protein
VRKEVARFAGRRRGVTIGPVPEPSGSDLLRRHLPVLRFDSQGSFLADSPAVLTNRVSAEGEPNTLRRADGSVLADAKGGRRRKRLTLDYLGSPYADDASAAASDYLDARGRDYVLQAREMHRPEFADRIQGRALRADDGGWWLQYWFFYLFNNKAFLGFGLHEGDWEMVQLRLGGNGRPRAMAFAQHEHGQRCDWDTVEKLGERPVVYVARGSQASYATAGRHEAPVVPDYADGRGPEVRAATLVEVSDTDPGWVAWPGRWGSTRARHRLESNSPRGPAHQGKWADPATFHEEADEIDPRRRTRAVPPTLGPAPPEISARREDDHAVIAYRLPSAPGRPRAVQLVVTLDSPADALPPASYAHRVEQQVGEFEHPLRLDQETYVVRASAADEQGNASEVVSAELG